MTDRVVSFEQFKAEKTKTKNLASGDSKEIAKLYIEDFSEEFDNLLKEQRRNKKNGDSPTNS